MRYLFFILTFIFTSCNRTSILLKNYYKTNTDLHHTLSNSLMVYTSENNTEVTMRRRLDGSDEIYFGYSKDENHEIMVRFIKFDNLLNRIDLDSEYTANTKVPIEIINLFKQLNYSSLIADSSHVFFGYKDNLDGNSKMGITIDKRNGRSEDNFIVKISDRVYITNGVIP